MRLTLAEEVEELKQILEAERAENGRLQDEAVLVAERLKNNEKELRIVCASRCLSCSG